MANETQDWKISTDIYDIVGSVDKLKQRYISDQDETTLSLGIFGFITDTESKKIQSNIVMTGILGNEMFPLRANLTKNVLTHAIYNNITDINAVPARITINLGIKISDFDKYNTNNKFVFDCMNPIFIGDYEFHFDYDVILTRSDSVSDMYSAHYDMDEVNYISNINQPYLKQPFIMQIGNDEYIIFQATIRQYSIEETNDKIISDSIIDAKSYSFSFNNQLALFDLYVTDNNNNGKVTRLTPLLYGSSADNVTGPYCWYLFLSDNTVRITFDTKSYIPGLNSDIYIKAYTTLGADGVFTYNNIDSDSEGLFVQFDSEKYNYNSVTCYMVATTDSTDGTDRKTKSDLQKLIPKAAMSRGSITTETDLNNYFNLIDSPDNRLVLQPKVDNQLARIWYGYFVLKDELENVIPTNTIRIQINHNESYMIESDDGRYILPAGTIFKYDPDEKIGMVIDEADVPELYTDEYYEGYYYMTVYNIVFNKDPLYSAFYLTIINQDSYYTFNWVNEDCILQFVANSCSFKRNLLTDQSMYKFTYKIAQSISNDFGLYNEEVVETIDDEGNQSTETIVTNNIRCIAILYKDGAPYRWADASLTNFDSTNYVYSWELDLETDNSLDNHNNIKILNLHVIGKENIYNYGYFDYNTQVRMYILAKFEDGEYGRYDLDDLVPGLDGYTVTNVYDVEGGLELYENFTNITNTKTLVNNNYDNYYVITGVPCVGLHYMNSEEQSTYLIKAIDERKSYIEYCLDLVENNMDIDFKFFNTYGPSLTYTIGDKEKTLIGPVDLTFNFRLSLKSSSDMYTKDDIIKAIKDYIEDLNETGDWHAPNMIAEITKEFSTRINFIEFMNYNNFRLGVQHITKLDIEDPHTVPEFLNIRNTLNIEGELEPMINIEVVTV